MFYARDDFGGRHSNATPETVRERFQDTLARARPKELAHDYLERESREQNRTEDLETRQQHAAERWFQVHHQKQNRQERRDYDRQGPEDDFEL
jgi:hypothetical protein